MRTTVITIASGRHGHLARQRRALAPTDSHVVVAMGRGEAPRCRSVCGARSDVLAIEPAAGGLPLAAARNAGAARALHGGAELLVFLDVDCIPGDTLTARYRAAARAQPGSLLCGPVGHLPPPPPSGYPATGLAAAARVVGARPVPPPDELRTGGDHALFWTLSFAITAATWAQVGGFDEAYVGYGGEDTDFGQRARRAGVGLCWVEAPGRSISTTRPRRRPSSTSRTSCATQPSSGSAGAGGRCRDGCTPSRIAASPTTTATLTAGSREHRPKRPGRVRREPQRVRPWPDLSTDLWSAGALLSSQTTPRGASRLRARPWR